MDDVLEREHLVITLAGVVRDGLSGEWLFRYFKGEKDPSLENKGKEFMQRT